MTDPKVKRVLMSVTDKTGIVEFARALTEEFGCEVISTGGTAKVIAEAGVPVTPIDDVTQFPEMMDGRVKTLHPRVHGGLLAKRDNASHMAQAAEHGIEMIDMVVVNLYAFEKTVASGADFGTCIENIDIGGPSMLRSAAKNFESVAVVTRPETYDAVLDEMRANGGATLRDTRAKLALDVFRTTSAYDGAIAAWMGEQLEGAEPFPASRALRITKKQDLRYGENPHQSAAFYTRDDYAGAEHSLAHATQHQGKEMSYNNYLDVDAAWAAVREYENPACVIVKHLTPCGVCEDADLVAAYKRAHECDPVSAYGGVMAFNRPVNDDVVTAVFENKQFVECIIAPEFSQAALEMYAAKPNARLLSTGGVNPAGGEVEYRSVEGGLLVQDSDAVAEAADAADWTVPTDRKPTEEEMAELVFAWKACKSVKSNAILIAKDHASVGAGGGQPNRVNSARIAVEQAGEKAKGAVAASDAFFPFRDGFDVLAGAGVTAVVQPGGSIRDEEVIAAANEQGVAMVFTGHRHFRH
ncbi:bifunctional phosphoribosylaminoimidazolecarboxamide formyltransferase/IMP cyclohydrolase [Xiamenia xianingshaonis]|uniref:Bifunctional purine biosynthesis protein PurH n=1 Tax=Xiamenia xianingshaonis TaxID=2682776 RepID=A0A9E6MRA6_9ACTN|nr:bifunctional phosphoribosylaminoimidazolecarboxamide formyltransferase/IMP cyclohydrolase [Xiamenia xianingshaonis]NHM14324.1 bifunctional phosphoribosylaminoimidazolecarboxamide formyltransferase/IMP cyclohydrolase [Xiamenia xianingshaonis]QTU84806.1 bifunctional phosphoribosylaminoimidazolecarboxamide formyltransferase/IMP cyclohydrolase [Xiamenia xianingshaonis]